MAEKVIVITGAAGLIGSGVVRYLNDLGYEGLILVDELDHPDKVKNLHEKKYQALLPISGLFEWLQGREGEIEAFIHLGACSDTLEQNENYLLNNNTRYTQRLAEYALKNGQRFIYASSAATYGDGSNGFSDAHDLLDFLQPLNLYGKSKHLFDLWAKKEGVLNQIVGLKYFNVFGPNENHKGRMASMVYKMIPIIKKEGVIRLFKSSEPEKYADGGQCRDFIYVKDAVKMTCGFLNDKRSGIFNIGLGEPTTWNQLANAVFKALNKPLNIEYIDMPEDLIRQYQNYTCAEMNKYSQDKELDLGYDTDEAVKDYVQNYILLDRRW
ncbi:MAG TPA: ADP-glyceromanno-heptose 6-epimerase [Rhabdochlamydiaceae bacterium]|jgi:ADP-L-glycero-D-manno-heptose 6-epimerase|nr:ADP-glyceromanno-heptose 6-epimerase [Rhabdochlamydiaceae bacterium]